MAATDGAREALAPTGRLRAGMNLGNALFTSKDASSGEVRGVSVDLMRELASRLGVPLELVMYATPGEVADAVDQGAWDVAILAIEEARARKIAFSPAMTEIEATYVVHEDSPLRSASEVDRPGVRIVAPAKAGYELYLTRTLRNATLTRTNGAQAAMEAFSRREADALPGLKPVLTSSLGTLPGARLVVG
jgi:polar amino acid transport system substrate-binding protein